MNIPKSTKILTIITLVLLLVAYFSFNINNKKTTFDDKDAQFLLSDSTSIHKIVINYNKVSLTLQKNESIWMVENLYKSDVTQMNQLLNFVTKVESIGTIEKDKIAKIVDKITKNGVEISVFSSGVLIKNYKIATDTTTENLNVLVGIMSESSTPYMLEVPGNDIIFTKLFDNLAINWRDKTLFNSQISSINNVRVEFNSNKNDGFEIIKGLTKFEVLGIEAKSDSIKILSYLDLFKKVEIKQYLGDAILYKRDSLLKTKADFEIHLQDRDIRKSNSIKIYYQPKQNGEIYGLVGLKQELVTIRPMIFEYLLQKRSFFNKK